MGLPEQECYLRNLSAFLSMDPKEMSAKLGVVDWICSMAQESLKHRDTHNYIKTSMPKVFCKDCLSYLLSQFRGCPDSCRNKNNLVDSYLAPKDTLLREPKQINANNDCPWYEVKVTK